MDPFRKIPKKFTKKFGNKVINRQYFHRKTGLKGLSPRQPAPHDTSYTKGRCNYGVDIFQLRV